MPLVDVTIYYLEMLAHAKRSVPAPRSGLSVIHAKHPTVAYYRRFSLSMRFVAWRIKRYAVGDVHDRQRKVCQLTNMFLRNADIGVAMSPNKA